MRETLIPRFLSKRPSEATVIPFPTDDANPPVTKINLAIGPSWSALRKDDNLRFYRQTTPKNSEFRLHIYRLNAHLPAKFIEGVWPLTCACRGAIMHWNDDARLNLANHLGSLRRAERIGAANRDQQDVGIGHFFKLLLLQYMAQVSQVTDHEVIHVNNINGIASAFRAALRVVVGGDAGNQDITDLIFAGTAHYTKIPTISPDAFHEVMARVVMTDGDDGGIDLALPYLLHFPHRHHQS